MTDLQKINDVLAATVHSPVGIPVVGLSHAFQVRRIYCVGRNYGAHIREMGGDEREPPFFFQKPTDAIVMSGDCVAYPSQTSDFQHEIELVLAIGRAGRAIALEEAASFIFGVAVGIDLTRRDLQLQARDKGRPWESGKSFDRSAVITPIQALDGNDPPKSGLIELRVNGAVRQSGDLAQMIWNCEEIICELSKLYELQPGDLIYTGTPAGVGKLMPGDAVVGLIENLGSLHLTVR